MPSLRERARAAVDGGHLDLPPIGGGATARRWDALLELAVRDVDLARLGEAHVDGVQILREAGREASPLELLGVWASEQPGATVRAVRDGAEGSLRLRGTKRFCSGAGIVDAALVTVHAPEGVLLVRVAADAIAPERVDDAGWAVEALAEVRTATVDLDDVVVPPDDVIGGAAWYLDRPGFWDGALGPAACWAGAAIGLVHLAATRCSEDPHARAHLGAMLAGERALRSIFSVAGDELDADGGGPGPERQRRALEVRHLVDERCADIEERFARCLGPRALAFDGEAAQRRQAVSIYRRQCHGERDLAVLGQLGAAAWLSLG